MASAEPEGVPEAATAQEAAPAGPRFRWPLLVLVIVAALLGLGLGAGLVLRGRSLGPGPAGGEVARPTFVVGASVSRSPVASPSPQLAESPSASDYVVQPGDTLRSIARDLYGDADQWPRIYDANRELIGADPDKLQAGMRLRIP